MPLLGRKSQTSHKHKENPEISMRKLILCKSGQKSKPLKIQLVAIDELTVASTAIEEVASEDIEQYLFQRELSAVKEEADLLQERPGINAAYDVAVTSEQHTAEAAAEEKLTAEVKEPDFAQRELIVTQADPVQERTEIDTTDEVAVAAEDLAAAAEDLDATIAELAAVAVATAVVAENVAEQSVNVSTIGAEDACAAEREHDVTRREPNVVLQEATDIQKRTPIDTANEAAVVTEESLVAALQDALVAQELVSVAEHWLLLLRKKLLERAGVDVSTDVALAAAEMVIAAEKENSTAQKETIASLEESDVSQREFSTTEGILEKQRTERVAVDELALVAEELAAATDKLDAATEELAVAVVEKVVAAEDEVVATEEDAVLAEEPIVAQRELNIDHQKAEPVEEPAITDSVDKQAPTVQEAIVVVEKEPLVPDEEAVPATETLAVEVEEVTAVEEEIVAAHIRAGTAAEEKAPAVEEEEEIT
eukprot:IDg19064t1